MGKSLMIQKECLIFKGIDRFDTLEEKRIGQTWSCAATRQVMDKIWIKEIPEVICDVVLLELCAHPM